MVTRIGDDIWMTDADLRSQAPGRKEIVAALGGRARILTELAEGRTAVAGEQAATPRNPQGQIGCDLSGPPWGSAIRHPIAWCSGVKPATTKLMAPAPQIGTINRNSTGATTIGVFGPWLIWNRPFEQWVDNRGPPYSRGYLSLCANGTHAASVDLFIRIWNETLGETPDSARSTTETLSVTTTEATYDTTYFAKLTGGVNILRGVFMVATDGEQLDVNSFSLNQIVKRMH